MPEQSETPALRIRTALPADEETLAAVDRLTWSPCTR